MEEIVVWNKMIFPTGLVSDSSYPIYTINHRLARGHDINVEDLMFEDRLSRVFIERETKISHSSDDVVETPDHYMIGRQRYPKDQIRVEILLSNDYEETFYVWPERRLRVPAHLVGFGIKNDVIMHNDDNEDELLPKGALEERTARKIVYIDKTTREVYPSIGVIEYGDECLIMRDLWDSGQAGVRVPTSSLIKKTISDLDCPFDNLVCHTGRGYLVEEGQDFRFHERISVEIGLD